ncbi:MAG: hypothetical protein HC822_16080 [Oscillochloris sp.]|nr:hypothetical protein [Oscillochloris sp.]
MPLVEQAAEGMTNSGEALTLLAALRYRCGQFAGAAEAAAQAQILGAGPEAAYYRGASLAALGATTEARHQLIRAADLAPASIWRARAELALATLP